MFVETIFLGAISILSVIIGLYLLTAFCQFCGRLINKGGKKNGAFSDRRVVIINSSRRDNASSVRPQSWQSSRFGSRTSLKANGGNTASQAEQNNTTSRHQVCPTV